MEQEAHKLELVAAIDPALEDGKNALLQELDLAIKKHNDLNIPTLFLPLMRMGNNKQFVKIHGMIAKSKNHEDLWLARLEIGALSIAADDVKRIMAFWGKLAEGYGYLVYFMLVFLVGVFLLVIADPAEFTTRYFHVTNPQLLITYGISGALLSWLIALLKAIGEHNDKSHLGELSIKLVVGVLVPIVLVGLVFGNGPAGIEDPTQAVSAKLIAFGCGFSSNIVTEICKKIMDKISAIVNAL